MECQDWKPIVLKKSSPIKPKPKEFKEEKEEDKGFTESPKMFDVSFGKKIERLRNQKGMKRSDLANKLNVKENVIESLEKGKELYNGQFLHKLKKILGNDL
jgi:ribosome-binding protein aMBF1 (putative translation factor)